eukprot:CAMPEP_0196764326 /NCGR_PEP_ID=MMETSP1095-20130614/5890_1 /TAXON_ID=96789 ORGANISM="Chromulina nebulosa, Strain UTEXLB2642" /NCGR_SAMPLE_ID=MMETSP1095 /ASSEMBLY_ACC=CAM_ASM_000446 /LENGTH=970 /DNA_ID=CAMNT_0042119611 /DNA_START=388 /DNA_END=3297 /DNA_ORIENTATION=+
MIYVYRFHQWTLISTKDLLPNDIISLAINKNDKSAVIPVDCLILKGSAIVNEASLTGESIPQMKEAITIDVNLDDQIQLDMQGVHRINTLFSGSNLLNIDTKLTSSDSIDMPDHITTTLSNPLPNITSYPPDGGLIAYVLKTGFYSSQGTLLQLIEYSQQAVTDDSIEIGLALLLLLVFAIIAASYIFYEGIKKKEKTTHELLLKCVLIVTSIVPRQLPMQMAMAVNMALMSLTKQGIFCMEPFKVPVCGKITHCLFDKTGTLTTDQLVPVGIIDKQSIYSSEENPGLIEVSQATEETALILAACHSLVEVENESEPGSSKQLVGDPIEVAALQGVKWTYNGQTSTATPGVFLSIERKILQVKAKINELLEYKTQIDSSEPKPALDSPVYKQIDVQRTQFQDAIVKLQDKLDKAKFDASQSLFKSVKVLQRYHFSSKLQRMSVLCQVNKSNSIEYYSLVKGSPEAIKSLLKSSEIPKWYNRSYETMARNGLRVLALAYKPIYLSNSVSNSLDDISRSMIESELYFGGFISFECKIRSDTKLVIQSLLDSYHSLAMVTGDAIFTSLHVANHVGICNPDYKSLILTSDKQSDKCYWKVVSALKDISSDIDKAIEETIPFSYDSIVQLSNVYNLLTTESDLLALVDSNTNKDVDIWKYIEHFKIFARMSPQGKALIIKSLQHGHIYDPDITTSSTNQSNTITSYLTNYLSTYRSTNDKYVLMCGDGGNDVGALKQADIGLALLAGHANSNTTADINTIDNKLENKTDDKVDNKVSEKKSEEALNVYQKLIDERANEINKKRALHMKEFQARFTKQQQIKLQDEIRQLSERGEYFGIFGLMKNKAGDMKKAMDLENARFMALHGQVWDPSKNTDQDIQGTGLESMFGLDTASADTSGLPMIRPGDASIAAPFTSRIPSIRAVIDLIRQGRCTLLSALMQQQIMMLESIISAYTLSSLSLHNSRSSERQMMATSW